MMRLIDKGMKRRLRQSRRAAEHRDANATREAESEESRCPVIYVWAGIRKWWGA